MGKCYHIGLDMKEFIVQTKLSKSLTALLLITSFLVPLKAQSRTTTVTKDSEGVYVEVKQPNRQVKEEILYRKSYALLIGNNEYFKWKRLPGVARDIPLIESVLRDKHGFVVEKALNLSKTELLNRIDEFISKYGQKYDNRLVIYYAGHGYTSILPDGRTMGYLVMKDAPIVPPIKDSLLKSPANLSDFRLKAISMDDIENLSKAITTRHALFVFDSCFSGTVLYRDNEVFVPKEISSEELEQMRGFLTAGNEKQQVSDDSPFRRAFIKGLEGNADTNGDGYILSTELGLFVKTEVYLNTKDSQQQDPIYGKQASFRRGDMIFISPIKRKTDAEERDENLWNKNIKNSEKIEDYEFYLRKCTEKEIPCTYKSEAASKIINLRRRAEETRLWNENLNSFELNYYKIYIERCDKSQNLCLFIEQAKNNLEKLLAEISQWDKIKNSNDIKAFDDYLQRCATNEFLGRYKTDAKQKKDKITLENADWEKIKKSRDVAVFDNYLKSCQKGENFCLFKVNAEQLRNKFKKETIVKQPTNVPQKDTRNLAPTVGTGGPTGLFTIYDGQTLRKGEFTFSIAYNNFDRDPDNVDITEVPVSFQIGLTDHLEKSFNPYAYRGFKVNKSQNPSGFFFLNPAITSLNLPQAIVLAPGVTGKSESRSFFGSILPGIVLSSKNSSESRSLTVSDSFSDNFQSLRNSDEVSFPRLFNYKKSNNEIINSLNTFYHLPIRNFDPIILGEKQELKKTIAVTDTTARIKSLQDFIQKFPNSAELIRAKNLIVSGRAELGEKKLQAGDLEAGIQLFKDAVADTPTPIDDKFYTRVILNFPTNLYYRGQQVAALQVAYLIEDKIKDNAKQILGLSAFYLGIERANEARMLAESAITLAPEMPEAYQTLGLAQRLNFELFESEKAYTKALELSPDSAVLKRSLAEIKRAVGKPAEAIKLYLELLKKDSNDAHAQNGLILSLFDAGHKDEAEKLLEKSLTTNQENLFLLTGAAYWYAGQNNGAKAIELGQKAVAIEPRYTWARIALARGLMLQNQPLEAEKNLLVAQENGSFPTLDYEIASARFQAGLFEEAARELKKQFAVKDGFVQTYIAGRIAKESDNFVKLLDFERKASIFAPFSADSKEEADGLKSLLSFSQLLSEEKATEEQINQEADDFIKGSDKMKTHRQLYVANRLLEAKKNLPKVLQLTQDAEKGLDESLEIPNPTVAVLADEMQESRALAFAKGEAFVLPQIPKETLSKILRGKIEEIAGWALFQQNTPQEAVVRLKRAVSIFPEKSEGWRSSYWKLGLAYDLGGDSKNALDALIKSYISGQPDRFSRATLEGVYRKVNGNLEGLDQLIGANPFGEAVQNSEPTPPSKPLFDPITIEVGKSKPTPTPEVKTETTPTSELVTVIDPFARARLTRLEVSEDSISILNNGGNLEILVGCVPEPTIEPEIETKSSSPKDVSVTRDTSMVKSSNRASFIIKSISEKKGTYVVTFTSPCGKKEIQVKVR